MEKAEKIEKYISSTNEKSFVYFITTDGGEERVKEIIDELYNKHITNKIRSTPFVKKDGYFTMAFITIDEV